MTAFLLYLIFCGFLWCFLVAETRSYNRLTHEPAAMVQLVIQPDATAELHLADRMFQWRMPKLSESWCFLSCVLPNLPGSTAIWTWRDLTYDEKPSS